VEGKLFSSRFLESTTQDYRFEGYKPDYWMGSLDEQLLEGSDYLEAQILSNPISHEGNEEDGGRIIYR
jgi:hypothetical protein